MTPRPAPSISKIFFSLLLSILPVAVCAKAAGPKAARAHSQRTGAGGGGARREAMALIPGATFRMGTDASEFPLLQKTFGFSRPEIFSAEAPPHQVTLAPFYLDRREVTNAQFAQFLARNPRWRRDRIAARFHNGKYLQHWDGDRHPEGKADHAVVNVSWYAAVAFCRWAGKRLPTEAEWEWAARGGLLDKAFPWGDEMPDPSRANYFESRIGEAAAVGRYPANGYGLFDMAGNVWEYLSDEWGPYTASPQANPVAGGNLFLNGGYEQVKTRRVIRGGSWGGTPVNLRVAYRDSHPPEGAGDHVGFRCAAPKT